MTEEEVKVLFELFRRRDIFLDSLHKNRSPSGLMVRGSDGGSHSRVTGFLIHICTDEQGAELLELIAKWDREGLQAVERKITDMGATLPAKEEV